jgi:hypothetical protein
MQVPVVPTLPAGTVVTAAQMEQLAAAVQFLLTPPIAQLQQTSVAPVSGGQSIPVTTPTAIIWTTQIADSDNGWTPAAPTQYIAQTPAYYVFSGTWQATAETTATYRGAYFQATTGPNNPGGPGLTTVFGSVRVPNVTTAAQYSGTGTQMLSPYLYAGDFVELYATSGHAETTGFADGGSFLSVQLASL